MPLLGLCSSSVCSAASVPYSSLRSHQSVAQGGSNGPWQAPLPSRSAQAKAQTLPRAVHPELLPLHMLQGCANCGANFRIQLASLLTPALTICSLMTLPSSSTVLIFYSTDRGRGH